MRKHFITYGDYKFSEAKNRILSEATMTNWFDSVNGYGEGSISQEIKDTGLLSILRGGGLWAWKPDIILKKLNEIEFGDILIYADSGCTLQPCKEWDRISMILESKELIAQSIYQKTIQWTQKEIIDLFPNNPAGWTNKLQYCATVIILKKTEFTVQFITEWKNFIIDHPETIKDVDPDKRASQYPAFIENRHDQSIYSALIYKYLHTGKIHKQFERIEDLDPLRLQAIRATRLRDGESDTKKGNFTKCMKRYLKSIILRPYYKLTKGV